MKLYFIHLPMKMEPIVSSETSAIRTQTPGNYPKRNNLHLEHGESLRTRMNFIADIIHNDFKKFQKCSSHRGILNATICSKHIKYSVQRHISFWSLLMIIY